MIHLISLSIPIGAYALRSYPSLSFILLLSAFSISLIIDYLRLNNIFVKNWFAHLFGMLLRPHESKKFTGSTYLLLSACCGYVLFSLSVFCAVMSFLVIGDTMAALIGKRFGKRRIINHKSLEGSMAFFFSSSIIVFFIPALPILTGLCGALIATTIELLPLKLDDNLSIPLLTGFAMTILNSAI